MANFETVKMLAKEVPFLLENVLRIRDPCGATLLKEVTLKDGVKRLYPHKVYCYQSIIGTLTEFVKRVGFTERCELWRNRDIRSAHQIICDVFEGRVWIDFQTFNGSSFLAAPRNYAFMSLM